MANHALFIAPDDTFLMGYIEQNYDKDQLAVVIYTTQQMEIKPLIGSGLYDELDSQITANTLTALNTTLLNKIKDALRFFVISEWPFVSNYKMRSKGIQTIEGDKSSSVGIEELVQLTQRYKDKAQVFADRVTKYLCENQSDYPLFNNPGSGADVIFPKRNNFDTGFVMDDPDEDDYFYRNRLNQPSP